MRVDDISDVVKGCVAGGKWLRIEIDNRYLCVVGNVADCPYKGDEYIVRSESGSVYFRLCEYETRSETERIN